MTASSSSLLARTRLVMHHPFFPENIGSVARAMHNMGLPDLWIVAAPHSPAPTHENAYKLAVASGHILEAAQVHADFEEAIEGCTLVIGSTSHPFEEMRPLTPFEASRLAASHDGPVALVLGNEKNGLAIGELRRCHEVVRIPCPTAGASLNLAQATMILCYEWLSASLEGGPPDPLVGWTAIAPPEELDALAGHLDEALVESGLFKPHNADKHRAVMRRLLGRLRLDSDEAALLRSLARKLEWYFGRHPASSPEA